MTPGARLHTAVQLLQQIETGKAPADVILDGFFRGKRFVGAKDRRAISELVFESLRRRARVDWWIARALGAEGMPDAGESLARARIIAYGLLCDRLTAERVDELFNGGRHCPPRLTDDERTLAEALENEPLDHPEMPLWVAFEFPSWLAGAMTDLWGKNLPEEANALNEPAALDLRVSILKADREAARRALAEEGHEAEPTPYSPLGLRLNKRIRLGGTQPFRDGLVEVQDEGSQLISLLVGAVPGQTVTDFCAGAGGKTLALAGVMRNKGRLIACDISPRRLSRLDNRLSRAGANIVECRRVPGDNELGSTALQSDRVLLDVPCSGSGTWRRSPDAKWRLGPGDLERLLERQRHILGTAHRLVADGGRLIYATCSVLPAENEHQVLWFLENHPDFTLLPIDDLWPQTVGGKPPVTGPFLRLSPARHRTDGFFAAVMERRG